MIAKSLGKSHAAVFVIMMCIALTSGVWFAVHYLNAQKAAHEITRHFLRLERAIGYNGFIHNFKNYVLRPGEDIYLGRAEENYRDAQTALEAIEAMRNEYGFVKTLHAVEETLRQYHDMIVQVQQAKQLGRSVLEIDAQVRISDTLAGSTIAVFQNEIEATITKRHNNYFLGLVLNFVILTVMFLVLFRIQFIRRRAAEIYNKRLQQKEKLLLKAESLAKLGRWKTGKNGALHWSESTMRIFGITASQPYVSKKFFWSRIPPEDRPKLKAAIRGAVNGGNRFTCVHRLIQGDGTHLTICNTGDVIRDSDGNLTGFVGTFQDISSMVEMEDRLNQAKQMEIVGKLSGGLAHDFNNLLAIIQANLQLVMDTKLPSSSQAQLHSAMLAINRGADLTKSMLSYARKSLLRPTRINLNQMVRENMGWSTRLMPPNIELKNLLTDDLWDIHTDASLAQSALLNLVMNAKDALPNGGKITVRTENIRITKDTIDHARSLTPGNYVVLSVSDTGKGIPQSILPKIFDPFYTTKPVGTGSGLGLSMVVGFMEQTNGAVDVATNPQLGTTFKLYFKASTSKRDSVPQQHDQKTNANLMIA